GHTFLFGICGLRGKWRREGNRIREAETGNRGKKHGGIFQAAIWRGCAEGGGSGEHGVRRGIEGLQGRFGVHARSGQGIFPQGGAVGEEAVYLFVRGREQRCVSGNARIGRGIRRGIFRRVVRTGDLEGRNSNLR